MSNERDFNVDKEELINKMFIFNLKYVGEYSEFIYNSLYLNWNNFIDTTNNVRHLDKLKKNLAKLAKMENKKSLSVSIDELIKENEKIILELSNDSFNRFVKKIMEDIELCTNLNEILLYYLNLYIETNKVETENNYKDSLEELVKTIKLKNDQSENNKNNLTFSQDKDGKYYSNILIENNKMILDKKSFEMEVSLYNEMLYKNKSLEILEDKKDYSPFEKKRRIYVKSMFEMDRNMVILFQKKLDITFPAEKVFKIAKELVDYIYIEIVDYEESTSVFNTLTNLSVEAYGTRRKVKMYDKLINSILSKLNNVDSLVYEEIINSAKDTVVNNGYKEFRNIKEIFPMLEDIYNASNEKIVSYVRRNINLILNEKKNLNLFVINMSVMDIVNLYNTMREEVYFNKLGTKYFVIIQKIIVNILKEKFNLSEEDIFKNILKENKLY